MKNDLLGDLSSGPGSRMTPKEGCMTFFYSSRVYAVTGHCRKFWQVTSQRNPPRDIQIGGKVMF